MLEILDIDGIMIFDSKFNRIYGREYSNLPLDKEKVRKEIRSSDNNSIFLTNEHLVLYRCVNDIYIVFYASLYSNEVFLNSMMNLYLDALRTSLKKTELTLDVLDDKYDYLILLTEYFVYDGMFMAESAEELVRMHPKRNFENIKGMPVPKGFSSIFKKVKFFK